MFLRSRLAQVTIAAAVFLILGSVLPPLYNNQARPLATNLNLEVRVEQDGVEFTRHTTTSPAEKDSVTRAQSTTDLVADGETIAHITEDSLLNRESTYPSPDRTPRSTSSFPPSMSRWRTALSAMA